MPPLRAFVCALLLASVTAAQQVTMTWSLPAPLSTDATVPGASDPRSGTAIPVLLSSSAAVGSASASALLGVVDQVQAYGCSLTLQQRLTLAAGGAPGAVASANADIRLHLTATVPQLVRLQLGATLQATAGAPAPVVEVDLHDDGSIEFAGGVPSSASLPVALGAAPTTVRVRAAAALAQDGNLQLDLSVLVLPVHDTVATITTFGCSDQHLYAQPTFGGGLELGVVGPPPSGPVALVIGLGLQPTLVPSALPVPCILVPTLDFVVALPLPNGFALALPPSVRPVTFWVEAIPITPVGLEATGSYRVVAN